MKITTQGQDCKARLTKVLPYSLWLHFLEIITFFLDVGKYHLWCSDLNSGETEGEDYAHWELSSTEDLQIPPQQVTVEEGLAEISLNALHGSKALSTIRLQGKIRNRTVHTLIDSGPTHSFVDTQLVKELKLVAEAISPLSVTVAYGTTKLVGEACRKVKYTIQGNTFYSDFRLYPLRGSDVILGVDWLQQHNPITFDFQAMSITINKEGKTVVLKGAISNGNIQEITGKQLQKMFKKAKGSAQGYICMIHSQEVHQTTEEIKVIHIGLQILLHKYEDVFREPTGLPPPRKHDHHIPLLTGSQPVNQRSYRVPYVQKSEIEK